MMRRPAAPTPITPKIMIAEGLKKNGLKRKIKEKKKKKSRNQKKLGQKSNLNPKPSSIIQTQKLPIIKGQPQKPISTKTKTLTPWSAPMMRGSAASTPVIPRILTADGVAKPTREDATLDRSATASLRVKTPSPPSFSWPLSVPKNRRKSEADMYDS